MSGGYHGIACRWPPGRINGTIRRAPVAALCGRKPLSEPGCEEATSGAGARDYALDFESYVTAPQLRQTNPTGKSLPIFRNRVKPVLQKYFCFLPTQISSLIPTVRSRQEGRCARHQRGAGCGGRGSARDERGLLRTAKSCGSDAPIVGVKPVRRST